MDIRMPTKSTTSESSIGDKTGGEKASNFTFSPRAVEATMGDNSQEGSARKILVSVEKTVEASKSESASNDVKIEDSVEVQDSGCGDVQIEVAEVNISKKMQNLEENVVVEVDVESSSDSERDELIDNEDDLDDNQITTWTWKETTQDDDDGKEIKCVDILYDDMDSDEQAEDDLTEGANLIYGSTPVTEILNEDNKDYSDVSSEILEDDFDGSAEACFHRVHHPSLLSTSIEEDEDDYEDDVEDDDINGFHSHYKRANTSDEVDGRDRGEDNYYDDFVEDDVNDPELKLWLRRKMRPNSTDNSAQSDSLEEELARLEHREPQTVIMADKSVQVCEDDIASSDRNQLEFDASLNWLKGVPTLEVISQVSRPTQTLTSFLRGGEVIKNESDVLEGDGQRLSAGDDGGVAGKSEDEDLTSVAPSEDAVAEETKIEENAEDEKSETSAPLCNGLEASEEESDASMPEHLEKLLSSLHEIPPVPSEDGSCNMWMVPAQDENGNCMNVVLDNGEMYDIFIFRPSCPTTSVSTQTIEEEFDVLNNSGLMEPFSDVVVVS